MEIRLVFLLSFFFFSLLFVLFPFPKLCPSLFTIAPPPTPDR